MADLPQEGKNEPEPVIISDATYESTINGYLLVVIDFWAPWCTPCRKIASVIDELNRDYHGQVVFAKLNTDDYSKTADRLKITSIPTVLITKNGKEVERIVGSVQRSYIEEKIQKHMKP
jgi:thioredoxin 1